MEHFPIVQSIIRIALDTKSDAMRHQVDRLKDALKDSGEVRQAAAITKLLLSADKTTSLSTSRLRPSASPSARPALFPDTGGPVDRETSNPLADIIFPDQNYAQMPTLSKDVLANVEALRLEWAHHDELRQAGLKPASSALIFGPPGTGKTTLGLALARELGLPAVVARLDGLISSFLGTTARNIGALFTFANKYDCILVLDEFDAIAKVRDDPNEVGEIKRIVNALLQNLDTRKSLGITLGITNHEVLLDSAIWRRFEVQLAMPLPELTQRVAIASRGLGAEGTVSPEAKLIAWIAAGTSGAEVEAMTEKYKKRLFLSSGDVTSAIELIRQIASSTAGRLELSRYSALSSTEQSLSHQLSTESELAFTQSELASLFNRDKKTIGRWKRSGI